MDKNPEHAHRRARRGLRHGDHGPDQRDLRHRRPLPRIEAEGISTRPGRKGVKPRLFAIAVDGLSIIVNEKNPLTKLTMAEVGAIYRGDVKNWKAFGGPDMAVSLYGRQSNSGTYVFLQEHVLKNKNYSPDVKEMNGNAQIIEGVLEDEAGIGYVGVGYVYRQGDGQGPEGPQGPEHLQGREIGSFLAHWIKRPSTRANIRSPGRSISRPTANPAPTWRPSSLFELGPEGQKIVEREGLLYRSAPNIKRRTIKTSNDSAALGRGEGADGPLRSPSSKERRCCRGVSSETISSLGCEKTIHDETPQRKANEICKTKVPRRIRHPGVLLHERHPGRPGPARHLRLLLFFGRSGLPGNPSQGILDEHHSGTPRLPSRRNTAFFP